MRLYRYFDLSPQLFEGVGDHTPQIQVKKSVTLPFYPRPNQPLPHAASKDMAICFLLVSTQYIGSLRSLPANVTAEPTTVAVIANTSARHSIICFLVIIKNFIAIPPFNLFEDMYNGLYIIRKINPRMIISLLTVRRGLVLFYRHTIVRLFYSGAEIVGICVDYIAR